MTNFPDRTQPLQPKKHIKPVITGTKAERPASRRFFNFMFAESPRELGARIVQTVVVPRLKLSAEEAINGFLAGMLWGNGNRPFGGIVAGTVLRSGQPGVNPYHVAPGQSGLALAQSQMTTTKSSGTYTNVLAGTQQQAELVLANLYDLFNEYNVVAIGDLYEMSNIKPSPADNAYGWYSLDGARIVQTRDGYEIEMPRPVRIHG